MKAFREGVFLDCEFMTAPFAAAGPPDELIAFFYPNRMYFQWYLEEGDQTQNIQQSLDCIKKFIQRHGPFDGLLGFSQGAEMCTRLMKELETSHALGSIRMVILISGVPPGYKVRVINKCRLPLNVIQESLPTLLEEHARINVPSLHMY